MPDVPCEPDGTGDRLEAITDAFVAALRAGDAVTVEDVVREHPEFAIELRELLPAVAAVEELAARQLRFSERQEAPPVAGRLGDFRIGRELGRGGMGIVYAAVQESLGRTVALKVLPQSAFLSATQIDRFRQEARTASRLQHPDIVPIHAIGSEAGVDYFAMPLIEGVGLDRLLPHLQPAGAPVAAPEDPLVGRALAWLQPAARGRDGFHRRLASIGARIADALEHAHRAGVLHRDVKPANLLLEADGKVWVTDFGVAKSLDRAGDTRVGELLGTLHYVAPESFDGEVDARGDVYALGLTLWELAAGASAWHATGSVALVDQIRRGIDRASWRRLRGAPRDLVTVLAKATAVEPDLRYATAAQFAVDLRRFVAGHPVLARGVSTSGRVLAWCRRNRLAAAAAGTALVAVVSAAAIGWGAFWTAQQALAGERRANGLARQHMDNAIAVAAKAEANLALSLESYDELFDAIAADRTDDAAAELAEVPTMPPLSRKDLDLLQRVLAFYEQFAATNAEHDGLRQHAVRAFRRAGDIHRWMGDFPRAIAALQRAVEFHGRVPVAARDEGWHVEQGALFRGLGVARSQSGGGPAALFDLWRARDVLQGWSDNHASRRCRHELARVHNAVGVAMSRSTTAVAGGAGWAPPPVFFEQRLAADAHQKAVSIAVRLVDEAPADRAALLLLARSHRLSAQARLRQKRAEGMAEAGQSLRLLAELSARFPDEPGCRFELAEAHSLVGVAAEDPAERAQSITTALRHATELLQANATMPEYEELVARVERRAGESALRDGDCERALAAFARSAAIRAELWRRLPQVGHHAIELLATAQAQAQALRRCGSLAAARQVLEEASTVARTAASTLAPPFAMFASEAIDQELARLLREVGDEQAAEAIERRRRDRHHRGPFGRGPFGRPW